MFCLQKEVSKQSERVPFIFIVSVKLTKQCSFSHAYKKNCKWRMHMCLPFCGCNATPSQTSPSPPMVRLIGQITCRQACALFGGSLPNFRSQGGEFLLCGCKKIVLENVYHFFCTILPYALLSYLYFKGNFASLSSFKRYGKMNYIV